MNTLSFASAWCRGQVQSQGAMMNAEFNLPDGRWVAPFAVAPWGNDQSAERQALPPILRNISGEWPCVPFGVPGGKEHMRRDLPADWSLSPANIPDYCDPYIHGYGSNADWQLSACDADQGGLVHTIEAQLTYPAEHSVNILTRSLTAAHDHPALLLALSIEPKRDCALPLGVHPVFRLPNQAEDGVAQVVVPEGAHAWTFPIEVEPGRSLLKPDQRGVALDQILDRAGQIIDPFRLPMREASEDLLMLTNLHEGRIKLVQAAAEYQVELSWDISALPSCLLWISTGGRLGYPWNGRYRGIGIEPICAPFDLGMNYAGKEDTPLAKAGIPTAVQLEQGKPWQTRYKISVNPISPIVR